MLYNFHTETIQCDTTGKTLGKVVVAATDVLTFRACVWDAQGHYCGSIGHTPRQTTMADLISDAAAQYLFT